MTKPKRRKEPLKFCFLFSFMYSYLMRERERVFGGLEKSLAQTILSYFQCSFYIVIVHQSCF